MFFHISLLQRCCIELVSYPFVMKCDLVLLLYFYVVQWCPLKQNNEYIPGSIGKMNMQATQFLKICGLSLSLTLIGQT